MVTPYSARTLAALARVFAGRTNPLGSSGEPLPAGASRQATTEIETPEVSGTPPRCHWVYFATTAKWPGTVTEEFVTKNKVIVRTIYNAAGLLIPNVQYLKTGDQILLVHGGHGRTYLKLFSAEISASANPVRSSRHSFDVFSYIDEALQAELEAGGHVPDPVVGRFTGITITDVHPLPHTEVKRPPGMTTIRHQEEVPDR